MPRQTRVIFFHLLNMDERSIFYDMHCVKALLEVNLRTTKTQLSTF